jgi:hypothetical protein
VVPAGTSVPSGTLWTGVPARQLRVLSGDELAWLRSSAASYGALARAHGAQGALSAADVEAQDEERALRAELRLKDGEPLPALDADVIEYYKLTAAPADAAGLLRGGPEHDERAEAALREAEEVAADAAENARYAHAARLRRVGAALKALAAARADRPAARAAAVADLASRDPAGAALLRDVIARAGAVAGAGAGAGAGQEKEELLALFARLDPAAAFYAQRSEAADAASAIFTAAAAAAREGGGADLPPPAAAAAAAQQPQLR